MSTKDKAAAAASRMPPLKHRNSEPFDIMQSEVAEWLVNQREIRNLVFRFAYGQRAIVFDQNAQIWHGNQNWKPK